MEKKKLKNQKEQIPPPLTVFGLTNLKNWFVFLNIVFQLPKVCVWVMKSEKNIYIHVNLYINIYIYIYIMFSRIIVLFILWTIWE